MGLEPETVSAFGAVVERLRKERGYSKQGLARLLGISRAQVWRIMTGRARLADAELDKLAAALAVPVARLTSAIQDSERNGGQWEPSDDSSGTGNSPQDDAIEDYLSNLDRILVTLRNFPGGSIGLRLKLGYLNAVEDVAREVGEKLPPRYWELRRRVHDGEV